MKKIIAVLLALVLCMGLCAPAFADDGWTIFVYLCGSDLESQNGFASDNMQEMIDTTANSGVRFIVETGGASAWQNDASPDELDRFEVSGGNAVIVDRQPQESMGKSETLRDFLRWENREHGTTILLTTHDMEDIAALCSRVMVLGHGQKLYDGDLPALLEKYDTSRTVTVRFEDPETMPALPEEASLSREGDLVKVVYAPGQIPTPEILEKLQQAGTIREMTIQPQNIDVLIAAMYREMDL